MFSIGRVTAILSGPNFENSDRVPRTTRNRLTMAPINILPFERPIYELEQQLEILENQPDPTPGTKDAIRNMRVEIARMKREIFENLDPAQVCLVSRHGSRPQTLDYLELVFDEFVELHGDKAFGDDRAIITGFAKLDDHKVLLVGQ